MKKVLVVMGSDSDLKVMEKCVDRLKSFDIPTEVRICSAHRTPAAAEQLAKNAAAEGFGVIIAAIVQFVAEPIVGLFTPDEAAIVAGGQYLRGYIFDCIFAGLHFSFSGYFCACGKSGLSFLHNITAIVLVRVPGVWLMSRMYPQTLLPMGLATAAGSALSVVICVIAYTVLRKKEARAALGW